jgi:hypothetical protein
MTESLGPAATYIGPTGETRDALGVFGRTTTAEIEAVFQSRSFIGSTQVLPVLSGNILAFTLANPSNSGVNLHLSTRRFSTDQQSNATPVEYLAYTDPTLVPSSLAIVANRFIGGPASPAVMRYQVGPLASLPMGGTAASGETVRTGGGATIREVLVIIPPGRSLGFTITGAGNNLSQAVRTSISLEWFEQTVA